MKARRDTQTQQMGKLAEEGATCVCFNLRKAARAITQLYDETLKPSGLRVTQLSILAVTSRLEPVTVSGLAEATVTDRTTLTRNLKLLAEQGFIRISPGTDRRERQVTLTERGRKVLSDAYPLWKDVQADIAKGLGPERLRRLLGDLAATVVVARAG